jgi:hypothetical protein
MQIGSIRWSAQTIVNGADQAAAASQAFLFYCFVFGQSLLVLDRGPRRRAQLIARSAEKLLDEKT